METRELSSAQTLLMKFVFPMIWIAGFGAGTLAVWFAHFTGWDGATPERMKWLFTLGWLAGTAVILWTCAPLKRVRLVGPVLHISDFRREIVVPLTSIDWVSENRWINIHPVTIHFRRTTEFGDAIVFMPKFRIFVSSHPVVAELERLSIAARRPRLGQ